MLAATSARFRLLQCLWKNYSRSMEATPLNLTAAQLRDNEDAQNDEKLALESIFAEQVTIDGSHVSVRTAPELSAPVALLFVPDHSAFFTHYLPPMRLDAVLPPGYPSHEPPRVTVTAPWLSAACAAVLVAALEAQWESMRGPALFTWIEYLRTEALQALLDAGPPVSARLPDSCHRIRPRADSARLHPANTTAGAGDEEGSSTAAAAAGKQQCLCIGGAGWLPSDAAEAERWRSALAAAEEAAAAAMAAAVAESAMAGLDDDDDDGTASSSTSKKDKKDNRLRGEAAAALCDAICEQLVDFDASAEAAAWAASTQSCAICLADKPGAACMPLGACGHVFCTECVAAHVQATLDAGKFMDMRCPDISCGAPLMQHEVRSVLSPDAYARYEALLLQAALDGMSDTCICPRPGCGKPASLEDANVGTHAEGVAGIWGRRRKGARKPVATPAATGGAGGGAGGGERREDDTRSMTSAALNAAWSQIKRQMGRCSYCHFVFCAECKKAWHGVTPCLDLLKAFREADEEGKAALKAKYGAAVFEELESRMWMAHNAKPCVACGCPTQKNRGCNHITCSRCKAEWCWVCGEDYEPGHFRYGPCEQFDNEYFADLGVSREFFYSHFVIRHQ